MRIRERASAVFPTGFGRSSADFDVPVWIDRRRRERPMLRALYEAVRQTHGEARIRIPYPQRGLHVQSVTLATLPAPAEARAT